MQPHFPSNPVSSQQIDRISQHVQQPATTQHPLSQRQKHLEPLRINADDQSQCKLLLYAAAVIIPIIFCVIMSAFALPQATKTMNTKQSLVGSKLQNCSGFVELANLQTFYLSCYTRKNFFGVTSNSMGIYVKQFSNLNQFMLFYIDLTPWARQQTNKNARYNENITFTIYSAEYIPSNKNIKVIKKLHSNNITIDSVTQALTNKWYFLGYQSKIASGQQFYVEITFRNGSVVTNSSAFQLKVQTVKENFTVYTILLRVAFFIVSLVVYVKYILNCLKVTKERLSIEQKGVRIIGALTLLFNDQFYFITVLWPNPFCSFLSALFIWSYLFGLFVLWCCFLLRILHSEQDTSTVQLKNPWRIAFFSFFYIIGLTVCAGYGIIQSAQYPMVSVNAINYKWFRVYMTFMIVFVIMAFLYLFYLYVNNCKSKPQRLHRHHVFQYISLFYTIVIITVSLMGSFQVFNFSAGLVFFAFGFNNLYSYFLMYLYSPSKQYSQNYSETDRQLKDDANKQQAKTVNIQLLQIDQEKQNEENSIKFDLQSLQSQVRNQTKQKQNSIRLDQKVKTRQQKQIKEEYMAESKNKLMKDGQIQEHQNSKYKSQISIEEQCKGHQI